MGNEKMQAEVPRPGLPAEVKEPHPPSVPNLKVILLRALELGRVHPTEHFSCRCDVREFTSLDAEWLIEVGDITSGPTYDKEHHSWKCEISGTIDRKGWKLVVALDCGSDFVKSPRLSLITVHRRNAKRTQRRI